MTESLGARADPFLTNGSVAYDEMKIRKNFFKMEEARGRERVFRAFL